MKVAFDNTFLALLFNDKARASIPDAKVRLDGLIDTLAYQKSKIIVPAPALAEVLTGVVKNGQRYLEILSPQSVFQVRPFDERCAVELSETLKAVKKYRKLLAQPGYQKIKFDRQIVAIAKVNGATTMYSDDQGMRKFALEVGLSACGFADLPKPTKQHELFTDETEELGKEARSSG